MRSMLCCYCCTALLTASGVIVIRPAAAAAAAAHHAAGGGGSSKPPACHGNICNAPKGGSSGPKGPQGKNVLFLASDDMRPEISPYGAHYMHTPNMQSLADDGFVFRRMYVQQALCAPSRTVML